MLLFCGPEPLFRNRKLPHRSPFSQQKTAVTACRISHICHSADKLNFRADARPRAFLCAFYLHEAKKEDPTQWTSKPAKLLSTTSSSIPPSTASNGPARTAAPSSCGAPSSLLVLLAIVLGAVHLQPPQRAGRHRLRQRHADLSDPVRRSRPAGSCRRQDLPICRRACQGRQSALPPGRRPVRHDLLGHASPVTSPASPTSKLARMPPPRAPSSRSPVAGTAISPLLPSSGSPSSIARPAATLRPSRSTTISPPIPAPPFPLAQRSFSSPTSTRPRTSPSSQRRSTPPSRTRTPRALPA